MTILCLVLAGWFGESGSGHKTTVARSLKDFTAVELQSSIDAQVHEGEAFAVEVTIDDNLQNFVTTEVKGGVLIISTKKSMSYNGKAFVEVTLPKLMAASTGASGDLNIAVSTARDLTLTTSGSGDIHFAGPLLKLTAHTHGSGDMVVDLLGSADTLTLATNGSGDITVRSGKATRLDATTNGSGDIDAQRLEVQRASFALHGSGDVSAQVEMEVSEASLRGSGDLELLGKAMIVKQSTHGSGEIRRH